MPNRRDVLLFFYKRRVSRPPLTRIDPRSLAYFAAMLVLIGLAGWLYLHQASVVAAYGYEIRELERDKEQIHREIIALRAEVATLGSLQRVLEVGSQLGYSLPEASDAERRLHVQYQDIHRSTPVSAGVQDSGLRRDGDSAMPPDGVTAPSSFFEGLVAQFKEWMESPMDAAAGLSGSADSR